MNIVAQCCGLVIMLVVLYFYLSQKKLKLYTQRAFMGIWSVALLSLIFDVLSVVGLCNMTVWPIMLVKFLCKGYLVTIVCMALLALRYVCADVLMRRIISKGWLIVLYAIEIADAVIIFMLPIELICEGHNTYTDGPAVVTVYAMVAIILCVMLFMVYRYRKTINPRRRRGVAIWGALWIGSATIQFFINELLIVSFASTIGILIIFLVMENPEVNLDQDTGLFNLNAFFSYMKQCQTLGQDKSILCLSFDNNNHGTISYDVEQDIYTKLISFMEDIPRATVFRSSSTEFLLVFDQEEYAEAAISLIEKRFEKPWGMSFRTIAYDWFYLETTQNVQRAPDVLPIMQYARQNRADIASNDGLRIDNKIVEDMYKERDTENEILLALIQDRVEVFYQPIYSTKSKVFTCAEALVRIRDVDGGIIPPNEFIPIAEKRGLIIKLGERVFEKVCQLIVEEKPIKYGLEYIEVNLSVIQCGYDKLADEFIEIMRKYKVDPKYIVLEITESASVKEKTVLLENMRKLREVGVRFALDDFGTGQSNLNYIVDMPVDVVKFDSSMTNAYFENGTAKYVMDAAMQMIQGMDLQIVSEGIEEKAQYRTMKELGIDYIQGYYFSKPVSSNEFIEFIKEKSDSHQ